MKGASDLKQIIVILLVFTSCLTVVACDTVNTQSNGIAFNKHVSEKRDQYNQYSFYGEWEVKRLVDSPPVSMHNDEDINKMIGKKFLYAKEIASSSEHLLQNPVYKISTLSKYDFEVGYKMSLKKLDINSESIVQVMIYPDNTYKDTWDSTGNIFFIKDNDTLILYDIECFEMKRIK